MTLQNGAYSVNNNRTIGYITDKFPRTLLGNDFIWPFIGVFVNIHNKAFDMLQKIQKLKYDTPISRF